MFYLQENVGLILLQGNIANQSVFMDSNFSEIYKESFLTFTVENLFITEINFKYVIHIKVNFLTLNHLSVK